MPYVISEPSGSSIHPSTKYLLFIYHMLHTILKKGWGQNGKQIFQSQCPILCIFQPSGEEKHYSHKTKCVITNWDKFYKG